MATADSSTAKVKRYECLFTTDRQQKKHKTWQDGAIRHHHYNSKTYLLGEDGAVLAETFYRPPAGGSKQRFADDFVLKGEVEFETGFIVEVGDLVWEGNTNLSDITKATKEARSKASVEAHAWAASETGGEAYPSPRPSSSTARDSPYASSSSKTSKEHAGKIATAAVNGSTYRGFGIAPPKSYLGGKQPSTKSRPSSSTPSKYSRPPQHADKLASPLPTATTGSSSKPYARPTTLDRLASLGGGVGDSPSATPRPHPGTDNTPMLGTPSRATATPFKPPRGTPVAKKGAGAGSAQRR